MCKSAPTIVIGDAKTAAAVKAGLAQHPELTATVLWVPAQ
jgi:hypothetical protein